MKLSTEKLRRKMNMKTTWLVALIFILLFAQKTFSAQNFGLNLILAVPQNEFSKNVRNSGIGLGGEGIYYFENGNTPFGFGLDLGYIAYGGENLDVPLSGVTVKLSRLNQLINFHVLFQLTTNGESIRPYFDLLFGGNFLFTQSTVTDECEDREISSSTNISDFAWSFGFGGGLMVKVYEHNPNDPSDLQTIFLDFKVRYLKGTEAEYLTKGSIIGNSEGTITLFPSRSKTDLLQYQIGMSVKFDSITI